MERIEGIEQNQFLLKLNFIGDLLYYDGPLSSLYRTDEGNLYLKNWLDSDDKVNRWCFIPTRSDLIRAFLSGEISEKYIIDNPKKGSPVFIVETGWEHKDVRCLLVDLDALPQDCLPLEDSFHDPDDSDDIDKIESYLSRVEKI
jgi:hypothetical protein